MDDCHLLPFIAPCIGCGACGKGSINQKEVELCEEEVFEEKVIDGR